MLSVKYIVAVSGGIDSVVLLDSLVRSAQHDIIVAHFDHGIRDDSAADARFVEALATRYHVPFVSRREELGAQASEDQARERRYRFLRQVASWHNGVIVTAHHYNDMLESIAINCLRGTGWRGVAVLDGEGIFRPLLGQTKTQLLAYALRHRLEWVEDSTNTSDAYLRNRLRQQIGKNLSNEAKQELGELWRKQLRVKQRIKHEAVTVTGQYVASRRYLLTMVNDDAASELLRVIIEQAGGQTPTRPQAARALLAVKTALPGSVFQVGSGVSLRFTKRTFIVETAQGVVS